ncbi:lysylphosphatidylglycerol synthase transmembrane domain-containing protein [Phyllobacterium sp. YR531]|uniref:lysylphosphatidylglycerol synthase transmembrane domain-containing protein n=1 Tax=Phyllobacterium sp. YR531 TaxID=1144343 RepID=UPI00026FA18C|nr:lysylphosphatidylglycerol synthase transmembrane domain-containing protein [Phyllobacterium sp. YR531]EJN02235.1 putative integral membrane protein [Phyllobacterium sp. YR531]
MISGKWRNVATAVFGITLVVLAFVLSDTRAIMASLSSAKPELVLVGIFLVQVQIVLSALRWCYTAARLDHPLQPTQAIADYYLGSLVNMTLPGGMAGDVIRAARSRSADKKWSTPVLAILLERFAGQIALLLVGAIGLIAWPFFNGGMGPSEALTLLFVALGILVFATVATLLVWFSGSFWWRKFIRKIGRSIFACYGLPYAWLVQGALSLTIVASYIAVFATASNAIGAPLPVIGLITVIPLSLLTMALPITVGGWGTREAAAAMLWPLLGLTASQGVAASVLYGVIVTLGALPGLGLLVQFPFRIR